MKEFNLGFDGLKEPADADDPSVLKVCEILLGVLKNGIGGAGFELYLGNVDGDLLAQFGLMQDVTKEVSNALLALKEI